VVSADELAVNDDPLSFRRLVGAQFLGAFNDNLFKQLVLFLAAGFLFPGRDVQGLAFAIFSLPFVLFSGIAGDLSEKYSKQSVIMTMKVAEVVIMLLGAMALQLVHWHFMLLVLFLMGVHSAFFGPSKYGVIPELVPSAKLVRANGVIAMTTFMSVLLGQALAGPLIDNFAGRFGVPGAFCAGFALLGTWFAKGMAKLEPQNTGLTLRPNPFGNLWQTIADLRRREGLFSLVVLYSCFWFDGGVIQQAIVGMGEAPYLAIGTGHKTLLSYLLVTLALSIIAGTLAAPRLARQFSLGRLAMVGASAMIAAQVALVSIGPLFSRAQGGLWVAHLLLATIGFSGAFFVVPLQSYLQYAPPAGVKGQTFAVNNFMNFLFMFLAGAYYLVARLPVIGWGPTVTQAIAGVGLAAMIYRNRGRLLSMRIDGETGSPTTR
jgi:MFS family permease